MDTTRRGRLSEPVPGRRALRQRGRATHRRRPPCGTGRRVRRVTHAKGAGESGLGRLIELHGVNTAGDAMVAVALANTLFFSVPTGEARGRVALYLLITMAPFAVMAPIIGPLLDRFRHGRRCAIAAHHAGARVPRLGARRRGRATRTSRSTPRRSAAWSASKAYGVTRSATVPRLLPEGGTLVAANSRISLAGIVAGAIGAGVAARLSLFSLEWSLRVAFVVFCVGMVLALRLPKRVDSTEGETPTTLSLDDTGPIPRRTSRRPAVVVALRANGALRAFSGFLTLFFAFLLREHPIGGLDDTARVRAGRGAAGVGTTVGTTIGSRLRPGPDVVIAVVLAILTGAALAGALFYGVVTVVAVAAAAGLAQSLGKLSLDAIVQRDVPEAVRTSAFARSETVLQLSWVVGGAIGIALPLNGRLGLGMAAAGLLAMLALTLRDLRRRRQHR